MHSKSTFYEEVYSSKLSLFVFANFDFKVVEEVERERETLKYMKKFETNFFFSITKTNVILPL